MCVLFLKLRNGKEFVDFVEKSFFFVKFLTASVAYYGHKFRDHIRSFQPINYIQSSLFKHMNGAHKTHTHNVQKQRYTHKYHTNVFFILPTYKTETEKEIKNILRLQNMLMHISLVSFACAFSHSIGVAVAAAVAAETFVSGCTIFHRHLLRLAFELFFFLHFISVGQSEIYRLFLV